MLWISRLIILLLCVFGNLAEIEIKAQAWWNDIFGDGIIGEQFDQDVSFLKNNCIDLTDSILLLL